ncbi:MAG TPA: protein phosphatase 2C domain-containing protein [Phototrophicaceae bacterium]|nr:protein phosphatase 2C domain-containing protein [Phototrophicaceae bacterium]
MSYPLFFGSSETGTVREDNQDAIRWHEPTDEPTQQNYGRLYAIADGMGGYEHGGVASTLALETLFNTFYSGTPRKSPQNLKQGLQAANLAVYQTGQRLGTRMGTTLSAINLIGSEVHIAHVGDSRIYHVHDRQAVCLTNDHTMVGELVRMRVLPPDKVRTHDRRSVLQKCLGLDLFVQPDFSRYVINDDDYLILCTDGLWAFVEDDDFAQIVTDVQEPQLVGQNLIELALSRSSDDNLSVLVIQVQRPDVQSEQSPQPKGLRKLLFNRLSGKS